MKWKSAKKNGRPTKYRDEYVKLAQAICAEFDATDKKLAKIFGVDASAISRWKQRYPKFAKAIQKGRATFCKTHRVD